MIIVALYGGLGNQMFQYALGRRIALKHQVSLWFDVGAFDKRHDTGNTIRAYGLNKFNIKGNVLSSFLSDIVSNKKIHTENGMARRIMRSVLPVHINEKHLGFDAGVLQAPKWSYLDGYWQTEKYFRDIGDIIRTDFTPAYSLSEETRRIARRIDDCDAVSLHVRRGDYVTNPAAAKFHGTLSLEWYKNAMDLILKNVPSAVFFVLTDDPQWARDNLRHEAPIDFLTDAPGRQDVDDLYLMSRCKHHVIANSSFSWWGAWLNPSPEKYVVAPQTWFLGQQIGPDRIPDGWMLI